MPKLAFAFGEHIAGAFDKLLQDDTDGAYFLGRISTRADENPTMVVESVYAQPLQIRRTTTSSCIVFRREMRHIRSDHQEFYLFWFVYGGRIEMTGPEGTARVEAGSFVVMHAQKPFVAEYVPDNGVLTTMTVNVPRVLFDQHVPRGLRLGKGYDFQSGEFLLCEQLLSLLFRIGEQLGQASVSGLVEMALAAIQRGLYAQEPDYVPRNIAAQRVDAIREVIDREIDNPDLSAQLVAAACGISVRYLHHLLQAEGTGLGLLVRRRRLDRAAAWLASPEMRAVPLRRIVEMSAFGGPAQFCRAFKASFGVSPSVFRRRCLTPAGHAVEAGA